MDDTFAVLPVSESSTGDESAELEVFDDVRTDGRDIAVLLSELCAVVASAVAEGAGTARSRSVVLARDRVLIPEIRVGQLIDIVDGLRPKMLGAAADACGMGASRLASLQRSIASRVPTDV